MEDCNLFKLLNLNPYNEEERKMLNCDAIIQEVQRNPHSAEVKYNFLSVPIDCFPFHQAIMLRAPLAIVDALYTPKAGTSKYTGRIALQLAILHKTSLDVIALLLEKHPEAIRETDEDGWTPLHFACANKAPLEVVSLLLNTWPDAVKQKSSASSYGCTPLYLACCFEAPSEVVSLLLSTWPDAAKQTTLGGFTPLQHACINGSPLEILSLLLNAWPDAIKQRTNNGSTPLHTACLNRAPPEIVSLLFSAWPDAVKQIEVYGFTPLHLACQNNVSFDATLMLFDKWIEAKENRNGNAIESLNYEHTTDNTKKLLTYVSSLFNDEIQYTSTKKIMSFFNSIKWWNGFVLLLEVYPNMTKTFDMQVSVKANLFSVVGKRCRLLTMWEVIRGEQDILGGV